MPLLMLHTSLPVSEDKRDALLRELSEIAAQTIGKPEKYVMAALAPASILMSGTGGPSALVEVRSIGGLSAGVNGTLSRKISAALSAALGIAPDRIYLNFSDVAPEDWGWNSKTFG